MSGNCQRITVIIKRKAAIGTVPYTYRDTHIGKPVILTRKRRIGNRKYFSIAIRLFYGIQSGICRPS